jgi:hypothetical protein
MVSYRQNPEKSKVIHHRKSSRSHQIELCAHHLPNRRRRRASAILATDATNSAALRGGVNQKLAIIAKLSEPAGHVRGLILDDRV